MNNIFKLRNQLGLAKAQKVEAPLVEVDEEAKPEPEPLVEIVPLFTPLTMLEQEWSAKLLDTLLASIDLTTLQALDEKRAKFEIREAGLNELRTSSAPLDETTAKKVINIVQDEIMGLGPLEPLLAEPTVSDILVNGAASIYVERHGKLEHTPLRFRDDEHLMRVIEKIVTGVGRRVDESSPMVDARLKDGSRVNAIIPPLALDGPLLSIRRFSRDLFTMENMVSIGSITQKIADVLAGVVKSRLNVIVSGGTGSGKTTMLNILSGYIPETERILTIEDSAELQLRQPHVGRLETRPANIEGKGAITQRDLVKNALRMRPDRIILGEIRQGEAFDMLQAMNTGHDGSLTTVHANTPRDALTRIENMVAMGGLDLPTKAVRTQIASAIDVVIQLERHEDGHRRMVSVQEINGMEGDIITMSEIFKFQRQGIDEKGNVIGNFMATGLVPQFYERLRQRGIDIDRKSFTQDSSYA